MTSPLVSAKTFHSFKDLARAYRENEDYVITCQTLEASCTGIVAPHGGGIETGTSEIARAIAATDFSLYLFEGIRPKDNFRALHLTSHCFDEPQCLAMLAGCDDVVTVHGCAVEGEVVLVGGLDYELARELHEAISKVGIACQIEGHDFPATHLRNVCNRGARNVGVQLEVSLQLRLSEKSASLANAVRKVLLDRGCPKPAGIW